MAADGQTGAGMPLGWRGGCGEAGVAGRKGSGLFRLGGPPRSGSSWDFGGVKQAAPGLVPGGAGQSSPATPRRAVGRGAGWLLAG